MRFSEIDKIPSRESDSWWVLSTSALTPVPCLDFGHGRAEQNNRQNGGPERLHKSSTHSTKKENSFPQEGKFHGGPGDGVG